jgi:mRNA interferase MazF
MEISQYQIILVSLDVAAGKTAVKTHLCLVISPDEMNKFLRTITVAPLTSDNTGYPTRIKIKYNDKISRVVLDQITTIEKQKIVKVLGELSGPEIKKLKAVLKETFID